MKISKLFHWLYAFLMLLPVFFVCCVSLYTIFNPNSKDSYYGETINEELKTEVDYIDLVVDDDYYLSNTLLTGAYSPTSQSRMILKVYSIDGVSYTQQQIDDIYYLAFYINQSNIPRLYFYDNVGNAIGNVIDLNNINVKIHYQFKSWVNSASININNNLTLLGDLDFYKMVYNRYSFLDNSFIYALNQINDVPVFSWAKTSFFVAPFTYISNLFGIPSTSPINTILSYWLAISICWLVFDLIMYVPLLVHRWIDKAKLE